MTDQTEAPKVRKFKCYLCGETFDSLRELALHDVKMQHKRRK